MESTTFAYGHISLLRASNGTVRNRFPLVKNTLSFGRLSSNDVRIYQASCSKVHCIINVDANEPYNAAITVNSLNGLHLNGVEYSKGAVVGLKEGDEIVICEKVFLWESAAFDPITIQSPRQSPYKVSKSLNNSPLLRSSPAPLLPSSPFVLSADVMEPAAVEQDLMSWDEQPDAEVDGPKGDLITWDEVEEDVEPEEEMQAVGIAEIEEAAQEEVVEVSKPSTPLFQRAFTMFATPSLAHRARPHQPFTPQVVPKAAAGQRRRSLRMTIIPSENRVNWDQERALKAVRTAAAVPLPCTPAPTPVRAFAAIPSTPMHSPSISMQASNESSTSRRISMLLLSGSPASLAFNSPYREEQNNDEEDDSSDEEDDEAVQDEEVAHFAVAKRVSLSPTRSVYTEEQDDAEAVNVSVDGDVEDMVIGLMAAQIALPDSPYGSPTATPAAATVSAVSYSPATPPRLPQYSLARRHSLREKVLIRSAIKKAVTPPETPVAEFIRPEDIMVASEDVEMDDEEHEGAIDEVEDDEEAVFVAVRPQDVPLPETPAVAVQAPSRTPVSSHRDSIELVRSRSASKHSAPEPQMETPSRVAVYERQSPEVFKSTTPVAVKMANTPVAVSARTSRVRVQAQAAAVPLPQTPVAVDQYVTEDEDEDEDEVEVPSTPIASSSRRPTFVDSPYEIRDDFHSEMTSPVTHHRSMATPRSVLRPSAASGRRKSIRGFLSFATPATLKRRVVFNEEVYIQEIVDIRDKRMHWNANLDDIVKQAAAIPLPESPAPFRVSTPRRIIRPATPVAPGSSARRAQRVATSTPSSAVRKVLEAQRPIAAASPRRVPASVSPIKPSSQSEVVEEGTPSKAPTAAPNTAARAARRIATQALLGSPAPRAAGASKAPQSAPRTNLNALKARVDDLNRRSSMPAPSTPITIRTVVAAPTPIAATPIVAPSTPAHLTPIALAILAQTASPEPEPELSHTPIQVPTFPRTLPTPNLAAGFRRLFSSPTKVKEMSTPKMSGFRNVFYGDEREVLQTPGMEGLSEMLMEPEVEVVEEVLEVEMDSQIEIQAVEAQVEAVQAEIEVAEAEIEVVEAEIEVVEAVMEVQVVEEVEASLVQIETTGEAEDVEMLEVDIPAVVEAVLEEPAVEVVEESVVEALAVEIELVVLEDAVVEAPIESVAAEEAAIVVEEVTEDAVVVPQVEEAAIVVEVPIAEVETPAVEEEEVAPIVEAPVPARRGRVAKVAAPKRATKTKAVEVAPVEIEQEAEDDEEEVVVAVKPTRAAAGRSKKAVVEAAVAPVKRGRGKAAAVVEVEEAVVEAPKSRGRKAAAVVEVVEEAVEETVEVVEVVETPAIAVKPAAKGRRAPRGRAATVEVEEVVEAVEVEAAVVEVVAPVAKGRKKAVKAVVEVVPEPVLEAEVLVEAMVEVPAVVVEKKKATSSRSKAAPKAMAIHEDPIVESPALVDVVVAAPKASRAKKVLQESPPTVVAKTARGKGKAATMEEGLKENVVDVAPVRALRSRR